MIRNRTGLVLALAALLALAAVPASAQDYPPDAATCGVSVTTPVAGQNIVVDCAGWMPNGPVDIDLLSQHVHLATVHADDNGEIRDPIKIPADTSPGDHTLRLSGINAQGEDQVVEIALTVRQPGAVGRDRAPGLAATGVDSGLGVLLGIGLLGAGTGAVYAARRRQAKQQA